MTENPNREPFDEVEYRRRQRSRLGRERHRAVAARARQPAMIAPRLQRQLTDPFRKKINRAPSPLNCLATSAPMPPVAPVSSTVLPANQLMLSPPLPSLF